MFLVLVLPASLSALSPQAEIAQELADLRADVRETACGAGIGDGDDGDVSSDKVSTNRVVYSFARLVLLRPQRRRNRSDRPREPCKNFARPEAY